MARTQPPMSHVTTVIPVYNGERFLEATLRSLVEQTRRPDRVVILENCSTDGTPDIARAFAREGFECRRNASHLNGGDNFDLALTFAQETDVLHILTADDLLKPCFFERLLEPLERVEGNALAYSAFEVIDEDGELLEAGDLVNSFPIDPGAPAREISLRDFLAAQSDLRTICAPAVLMKTNRHRLPVGFRLEFIQCADAVFYAEITREYKKFFEVPEALCQYRRHANTVTSRNRNRPAALIDDQWRATTTIDAIMERRGWLSGFRRRCFIAASTRILLSGMPELESDQRAEAVKTARAITGPFAWWSGNLAVALRAFLRQGRR